MPDSPVSKPRRNGGMKFGLFLMVMALAVPGFFWAIVLWRDWTRTYCSGECAEGWYAVISTFLAAPTFLVGLIVWVISIAVRGRKA